MVKNQKLKPTSHKWDQGLHTRVSGDEADSEDGAPPPVCPEAQERHCSNILIEDMCANISHTYHTYKQECVDMYMHSYEYVYICIRVYICI